MSAALAPKPMTRTSCRAAKRDLHPYRCKFAQPYGGERGDATVRRYEVNAIARVTETKIH